MSILALQQFFINTIQFGEPYTTLWLTLFTNLEINLVIILAFIFILFLYYGCRVAALVPMLCIGFDSTAPYTFAVTLFEYPAMPPISLLNGFLFIHPPFLYVSLAFTLLIIYKHTFRKVYRFYQPQRFTGLNRASLRWITITLVLGALWAQQELNWGGWWSWDLVETGSLILFLLAFFFLHFKPWRYLGLEFSLTGLSLFMFFFWGLRYGFFSSVHSFVASDTTHLNYAGLYATPFLWFCVLRFRFCKHAFIQCIFLLLYSLVLAFIWDLFASWKICTFYWPLNYIFLSIILTLFSFINVEKDRIFTFGFFPYLVMFNTRRWLWFLNGRGVHIMSFNFFWGVILTKGVQADVYFETMSLIDAWTVSSTFTLTAHELWEPFNALSKTVGYFTNHCESHLWGFPPINRLVFTSLVSSSLGWFPSFTMGFFYLEDLDEVLCSLDTSFSFNYL